MCDYGNYFAYPLKEMEFDECQASLKFYLNFRAMKGAYCPLKPAEVQTVAMGLTECDDWVVLGGKGKKSTSSDSDSSDSDSDSASGSDFDLSADDKKKKKKGKKGSSSSSDSDSSSDSESEKEETPEEKAKREAFEEKKRKYDEKTLKNTLKEQSNVVLDIKPEDDETNLDELIATIREKVVMEGLHWGAAEKQPLAYGIFKVRMISTIVNVLVSVDWMQETIEALPGVQSTDIVSFMKI